MTRTRHQAALTTDAVSTGTLTIRKPDYICISTDEGRNQLQMGSTQGGKHTNGGLDNVVQGIHLAWLTDACLEQSYLRLVVEQPDAQRNTL